MDDLDPAVALVYAQPLSGFVSARTALVKELKASKRTEDAARVAALRRPTKQAWAIGDVVRRAPEAATAFFAAIAGLAEPGGELRHRTNDLRGATAALVESVEGLGPGEATAALLAIAADPDSTEALRRGRLAEVPAAGGFGGLTLVPGPAVGSDPSGAGEEPPDDERVAAAGGAEREREEADARARAERLAALEAARGRALAAEGAAAERVRAAQAAVDEAEAELIRATTALDDARRAVTEAVGRLLAAVEEPA